MIGFYVGEHKPKSKIGLCCKSAVSLLLIITLIFHVLSCNFSYEALKYVVPSKYDSYHKNALEIIKNVTKDIKAYNWFFNQFGFSDKEANESVINETLSALIKSNCEQCYRYQLRITVIVFIALSPITFFFSCCFNIIRDAIKEEKEKQEERKYLPRRAP